MQERLDDPRWSTAKACFAKRLAMRGKPAYDIQPMTLISESARAELVCAYTAPDRHYHGLRHVEALLRLADSCAKASHTSHRNVRSLHFTLGDLWQNGAFLTEDLVDLLSDLLTSRWLQIAHRGLHITVAQPLLHGAQINSGPQAPSRKCRAEFVQPEVVFA